MKAIRKEVESDLIVDVFFTNLIRGKDGNTPYIKDRHWWIGGKDTGVLAEGVAPKIGANLHWFIDGVDTGVMARGQDGKTPSIGGNGNWWLGDTDSGVASNGIPVGVIVMWSGSVDKIPKGWRICDGTGVLSNGNAIPDLKGRFVVGFDNRKTGADVDYNKMNTTGGEKKVTLSESQMPAHKHLGSLQTRDPSRVFNKFGYIDIGGGVEMARGNWEWDVSQGYTSTQGGGKEIENRPPYYVLAYIIKL